MSASLPLLPLSLLSLSFLPLSLLPNYLSYACTSSSDEWCGRRQEVSGAGEKEMGNLRKERKDAGRRNRRRRRRCGGGDGGG